MMPVIDAHVHFSNIAVFADTARLYAGVDYSAAGFLAECAACGVVKAIGMGVTETSRYAFPDDKAASPMSCDLPEAPPLLALCPGVNPYRWGDEALAQLKHSFENGAVGVKIYAGYYPFTVDDPIYDPVLKLAAAYGKPVTVHTGDTYSERGLLAYARPLPVDQAAVRYREVNFIIAHMGDPWVDEACEIAYKNKNVYVDMSGLVVGGAEEFQRVTKEPLLMNRFKQGLVYLNQYDKVLYGTDWPLAPMKCYQAFAKALIPKAYWPDVFYKNAARVFETAFD